MGHLTVLDVRCGSLRGGVAFKSNISGRGLGLRVEKYTLRLDDFEIGRDTAMTEAGKALHIPQSGGEVLVNDVAVGDATARDERLASDEIKLDMGVINEAFNLEFNLKADGVVRRTVDNVIYPRGVSLRPVVVRRKVLPTTAFNKLICLLIEVVEFGTGVAIIHVREVDRDRIIPKWNLLVIYLLDADLLGAVQLGGEGLFYTGKDGLGEGRCRTTWASSLLIRFPASRRASSAITACTTRSTTRALIIGHDQHISIHRIPSL